MDMECGDEWMDGFQKKMANIWRSVKRGIRSWSLGTLGLILTYILTSLCGPLK